MLSDPFSTTYQGSANALNSYGQAFQSIADQYAKRKQLEKQKSDQKELLIASGLLKEEEEPASLQDYMKVAKSTAKQTGYKSVDFKEGATDDEKIKTLNTIFEGLGIPIPKGNKKLVVDPKAEVQANTTTGETTIKSSPKYQSQSVYSVNPITGELEKSGEVEPRAKVFKGVLSPEQMKDRAVAQGEAEFTKKNMEQTGKLGTAVKRLALLNKQYAKALPSGDRTPLEQRFLGGAESWAAKKGLINNPELVALQKNIRPMAINLIRAFGEVGNLSESEQKGAIDTVDLPGLTDQERIAQTKQFIEFALAGANQEGINMLMKQSDIRGILDAFGVDINNLGVEQQQEGQSGWSQEKESRYQELKRKRGQ